MPNISSIQLNYTLGVGTGLETGSITAGPDSLGKATLSLPNIPKPDIVGGYPRLVSVEGQLRLPYDYMPEPTRSAFPIMGTLSGDTAVTGNGHWFLTEKGDYNRLFTSATGTSNYITVTEEDIQDNIVLARAVSHNATTGRTVWQKILIPRVSSQGYGDNSIPWSAIGTDDSPLPRWMATIMDNETSLQMKHISDLPDWVSAEYTVDTPSPFLHRDEYPYGAAPLDENGKIPSGVLAGDMSQYGLFGGRSGKYTGASPSNFEITDLTYDPKGDADRTTCNLLYIAKKVGIYTNFGNINVASTELASGIVFIVGRPGSFTKIGAALVPLGVSEPYIVYSVNGNFAPTVAGNVELTAEDVGALAIEDYPNGGAPRLGTDGKILAKYLPDYSLNLGTTIIGTENGGLGLDFSKPSVEGILYKDGPNAANINAGEAPHRYLPRATETVLGCVRVKLEGSVLNLYTTRAVSAS